MKRLELDKDLDKLIPTFKNIYYYTTLGNLIYGIIHNLNGSIQLLTTNMEILEMVFKREKSSLSILNYFERCMEHIDKLRKTLEIILPNDEYNANSKPIYLNKLLEDQIQFFQNNLFFKHQVKVNKFLASKLPLIMGCLSDFRLAISNLIQNSIEAMQESPIRELTIITKEEDDYINLGIKDTGCGVSEEIRPYLFQPFFTTKSENHLGLGLYITKKVLQRYGTQIEYNSDEGETIFSLKIPFRRN